MTKSFLLSVLLSTVVLSDFAGPCTCGLNSGDEDPLSCSCYVCIRPPPADPMSKARPTGYAINAATDLKRGPTYAGQFAAPPAHDVEALYANPARGLCPPMLNYRAHYPFEQQSHSDFQFIPDMTFDNQYAWQIMVKNQWQAAGPQLFLHFGPLQVKGYKRYADGKFYRSAWDVVKEGLLKMRQPLSAYFQMTTLGKKPKNPCEKQKKSFAICTYCFSLYSMCTLHSVLCPLCFPINMDHIENRN